MKTKVILIIALLLSIASCSEQKKPGDERTKPADEQKDVYYFYDLGQEMRVNTGDGMILYSISVPVYGSMQTVISYRGYMLDHHTKDSEMCPADSFFVKPRSFLDSIQYYDSKWLRNENNLKKFWRSPESHSKKDSLTIYVIEPYENTDSLIFRRVNRFYQPNREGGDD